MIKSIDTLKNTYKANHSIRDQITFELAVSFLDLCNHQAPR